MKGILNNIVIKGMASTVPSYVEENILAGEFLGAKRCKKQIRLTGIERRHVSNINQKISDLCYVAAKNLMEQINWEPESIDVLVLLTQCPNYIAPSTSFLLQKMLHIPKKCVVFDVNLGCSSFNVGIQIVSSLLQQMPGNARGICLSGDLAYNTIHANVPPDAMAGSMLFGSAGSAVAVEKKNGNDSIPFATFSDGNRYDAIIRKQICADVSMDGEGVFNFATNDVVSSINEFRDEFLKDKIIDYYVFHQAQKLILDTIAASCDIPQDKELRSLRNYGNTSGASVPLSICSNRDLYKGLEKINVLSCGFGIGLSWSMAYTELETKNILPVIVTDEILEG